jgi:hypothetical protein
MISQGQLLGILPCLARVFAEHFFETNQPCLPCWPLGSGIQAGGDDAGGRQVSPHLSTVVGR